MEASRFLQAQSALLVTHQQRRPAKSERSVPEFSIVLEAHDVCPRKQPPTISSVQYFCNYITLLKLILLLLFGQGGSNFSSLFK